MNLNLTINVQAKSTQEAYAFYTEIKEKIEGKKNQPEEKSSQEKSEIPVCPKCGRPMILRQNGKKGDQFWGCPGYYDSPSCRGTRQYEKKQEEIPVEDEVPVLNF